MYKLMVADSLLMLIDTSVINFSTNFYVYPARNISFEF